MEAEERSGVLPISELDAEFIRAKNGGSVLDDPYYSIETLAKELGTTYQGLRERLRRRPCAQYRAGPGRGGGILIRRSIFEQWLHDQETVPAPRRVRHLAPEQDHETDDNPRHSEREGDDAQERGHP